MGALAGELINSTAINCHVTGEISLSGYGVVGGLAGQADYAVLDGCSVIGNDRDESFIEGIYAESDLEGDNIGGLVGMRGPSDNTDLDKQCTKGCTVKNLTISGYRKLGGLFGQAYQCESTFDATVDNIDLVITADEEYASGNDKTTAAGGMVGLFANNTTRRGQLKGEVSNINIWCDDEEVDYIAKMGVISGGNGDSTELGVPNAMDFDVTVSGTNSTSGAKTTDDTKAIYSASVFYDIWVGGRRIGPRNADDVFDDGTVSYDADTATLTLENYEYSGAGYGMDDYDKAAIFINTDENVTIVARGDNSLECTAPYGIGIRYSGAGEITVEGDGEEPALNITVPDTYDTGYAVSVKGTKASFNNLAMSIKGYLGIVVNGDNVDGDALEIKDCEIDFSGEEIDNAVWVYNDYGDGSATITDSNIDGNGGILVYGYDKGSGDALLTIEGSTIDLQGPQATEGRHGIELLSNCGDSTLTIDGSEVNVFSNTVDIPSSGNGPDGINVGTQSSLNGKGLAKIVIKNNSEVTASGKANGINLFTWGSSEHVNTRGAVLTITDSTVTAFSSDEDDGAYGITAYAYQKGDTTVTFKDSEIVAWGPFAGVNLSAGESYNDAVGSLKLTVTDCDLYVSGEYGIHVSTQSNDGSNTSAKQNVTINGGSLTCEGQMAVLGDGVDTASINMADVAGLFNLGGNDDGAQVFVTSGRLSISSGEYDFVYDEDMQFLGKVETGDITGGYFYGYASDFCEVLNDFCAEGYAAVLLTEGDHEDEYQVGRIVAGSETEITEEDMENNKLLYEVTITIVDEDGQEIATIPQGEPITVMGTTDDNYDNVTLPGEERNPAGGVELTQISDPADLSTIIQSAVEKAGSESGAVSRITLVLVSDFGTAGGTEEKPTVTYEVHPEAVVYVIPDGGEEPEAVSSVEIPNNELANTTFKVVLYAGAIAEPGDTVKVTHIHSDGSDPDFYTAVVDENSMVTITGVTKFSSFELAPISGEQTDDDIVCLKSLSLTSEIAINFYVGNLPEGVGPEEYSVTWYTTEDGVDKRSFTQTLDELETRVGSDGNTYYFVKIASFAAKQMTDTVSVTVSHDENDIFNEVYSIQGYCEEVIDGSYSDKLKNVCKAILDYGRYSQEKFDYKTDDLANSGSDYYSLKSIPSSFEGVNGSLASVASFLKSLSLESQVELNFYFKPANGYTFDEGSFTVEVNNTDCDCDISEADYGYWRVKVRGFAASQLGTPITVTVNDGENTADWTWSPLSFSYQNQNDDGLGNISKAVYNYYLKAAAYFS